MGIDRQRSSTSSSPRARRSRRHFAPCSMPSPAAGTRGTIRSRRRQGAPRRRPDRARLYAGATVPGCRLTARRGDDRPLSHRRPDLPAAAGPGRPRAPRPARDQPGHHGADRRSRGDDVHRHRRRRPPPRAFLLGWNGDYPDVTNFLDYHFGGGSSHALRRPLPGHRARRWTTGSSTADQAAREAAYTEANDLIKAARARWCSSPMPARRPAWRADRRGRPLVAPEHGGFAAVDGGEDGQLVVHAERRARRPVLRRRERRRVPARLLPGHGAALRLRGRRLRPP